MRINTVYFADLRIKLLKLVTFSSTFWILLNEYYTFYINFTKKGPKHTRSISRSQKVKKKYISNSCRNVPNRPTTMSFSSFYWKFCALASLCWTLFCILHSFLLKSDNLKNVPFFRHFFKMADLIYVMSLVTFRILFRTSFWTYLPIFSFYIIFFRVKPKKKTIMQL